MPLDNTPIRRKLIWILLLVCTVVLVLTRGAFFTYEYIVFRRTIVQEFTGIGRIIAANSTAALAFDNPDDAEEILSSLKVHANVTAAALYDSRGRLFARYPQRLAAAALPPAPETRPYRFDHSRLTGFEPVVQDGRRLGVLYLEFDARPLITEWLRSSIEIGLVVMVLVYLIAYWLSTRLQRQISGPIVALAQTAQAVSERSDYSVRAEALAGGELGLLTGAFNQMLSQIEILNRNLEQRVAERTVQLEAANKELEAFSYSISHDLRAPLRHIDGFTQLLAQRLEGKIDETAQRHLNTIIFSAKRLGQLIDELLVFCRMGRTEMRRSLVDSRALIDEIRREFEHEISGRQIDWRIADLPSVRADPAMIRQVWENLVGNALKYSQKRTEAVIEISHRVDARDGHVFTVRDNGAGFDMAYVAKLFGVFQRLHSAREFEGTGIGLANVRRIVERHGGRVWAEGKPDAGASFHFSLPESVPILTDPATNPP